jgi:mRNA interferase RelE/StbE
LAWRIEYDPRVEKDLRGLDKRIQKEILGYMETRIARAADPKNFGKALRHSQKGLWRYRVRDYRIICEIQQDRVVVLVIAVGHRSKVYDQGTGRPG